MRATDLLVKHKHIYIYYLMYLQANRNRVKTCQKKRIYIDVGRPFYVEPQAVTKILSRLTKAGFSPSSVDIADFERTFKEVEEVQRVLNGREAINNA